MRSCIRSPWRERGLPSNSYARAANTEVDVSVYVTSAHRKGLTNKCDGHEEQQYVANDPDRCA
jgi:hypothetical protein